MPIDNAFCAGARDLTVDGIVAVVVKRVKGGEEEQSTLVGVRYRHHPSGARFFAGDTGNRGRISQRLREEQTQNSSGRCRVLWPRLTARHLEHDPRDLESQISKTRIII